MALEHQSVFTDSTTGAPRRPDWQALHARLGAAHAARLALAEMASAPARGSFAPDASRLACAWQQGKGSVNPNALSNGKGDGGNAVDTAGTSMAGG